MVHYAARELQKDGKGTGLFHYTCQTRNGTYATGYCADDCAGHATREEAQQHYKQYLIDHAVFVGPKTQEWPKHKCAVEGCNAEATMLANVSPYRSFELCASHANKDSLGQLVTVGESWES